MAGESVRVLLECSLWVWDREDESAPKAWLPRWCTITKHSNRSNSRIRIRLNRSGPSMPIDSPSHEVPMENYAGLEVFSGPFEGRPNCFSLITFYRTYCFAVSAIEALKAWVDCIVTEIGFEWKFDVRVLATQNVVPPGEATMRFYPRFFSLTSGGGPSAVSQTPPACLGLWQHNHLRRYGGSQGFSFESGSRSIGGPEVYRLATHQGATIKELFDCVAHGKPLPDPPVTMKRTYSMSSSSYAMTDDAESWTALSGRQHQSASSSFAFANDTISLYSTTDEPAPLPAKAKGGEYAYVSVDVPRRPTRTADRDVNYLSVQVVQGQAGVGGGSVTAGGNPPTMDHPSLPSPTPQAAPASASSTIYSGVDLQKTAQLRDALVQSHRH